MKQIYNMKKDHLFVSFVIRNARFFASFIKIWGKNEYYAWTDRFAPFYRIFCSSLLRMNPSRSFNQRRHGMEYLSDQKKKTFPQAFQFRGKSMEIILLFFTTKKHITQITLRADSSSRNRINWVILWS